MSAMSEESPPPTNNPQDPLYYAPRRTAERIEPRLASVNDAAAALERAARADTPRAPQPPSALNARLDSAVFESLRRQMEPELVPEPLDFKRQNTRRTLLAIASGVAAALAVASVGALLFVTLFQKDKEAAPSLLASAPPSASTRAIDDGSKPALSQFRALVAASAGGQNFSHEQSERLLQQFVQWRQKAAATTDKP